MCLWLIIRGYVVQINVFKPKFAPQFFLFVQLTKRRRCSEILKIPTQKWATRARAVSIFYPEKSPFAICVVCCSVWWNAAWIVRFQKYGFRRRRRRRRRRRSSSKFSKNGLKNDFSYAEVVRRYGLMICQLLGTAGRLRSSLLQMPKFCCLEQKQLGYLGLGIVSWQFVFFSAYNVSFCCLHGHAI